MGSPYNIVISADVWQDHAQAWHINSESARQLAGNSTTAQKENEQMNVHALTKEERLCLQGWFRQAIAKVEREEATAQFIQTHGIDTSTDSHRSPLVRRRTRRSRVFSHVRELAI